MSEPTEEGMQLSPLKRAFLALEEMQQKLDAIERARTEPIAIIGMACRFPGGASTPQRFWELLHNGREAIGEIPADRWPVAAYYDPDANGAGLMNTRYGAFLAEIDKFDPQFFGIAPREAHGMDPQQRLLLEVCWEALEAAVQAPDQLVGSRTGVYVGIGANDYTHLYLKNDDPTLFDGYYASGIAHSIASGRISYLLGLQGPSVSLDTACSSSLSAVHLAVQSLRCGESDMALAGGVNLILSPENYFAFSKFGMLAPDGRCKTFDAAADGFVRGEGCGVIVLKRLADAQANGDQILALIQGSAMNQDGASSGLTAPNGPAQEALIRSALAQAAIDPSLVSYIEAHGTGTSLGDPIEVQALGAVFGAHHTAEQPLRIGSVKTNVGHMEAAAGIGGLIKLVVALQHQEIPPHLNFQTPSPLIPWSKWPLEIPTQPTAWAAVDGRRIAGVSAFGFSGTNVHVVLEAAPTPAPVPATVTVPAVERPLQLLTLSARHEHALTELAQRVADQLAAQPQQPLADLCYSANVGRAQLGHRLAVTATTTAELREKLGGFVTGQTPAGLLTGQVEQRDKPKIAFLFTGQGAQYVGMGRTLYETQPTFRAALDRCADLLQPHLEKPLLAVLYPTTGERAAIDQTAYTQPALFAIEYALAELWQSCGIEPNFVMGHSVGEYAAATVAGVMRLEDALPLVAARGHLMGALPAGGVMATVFADLPLVEAAVAPYAATVAIAAVNGPDTIVIAGLGRDVQAIQAELQGAGVKVRPLNVSHAFHSPLMEPILGEFERLADAIDYAPPRLRMIAALTGKVASGAQVAQATYWRQQSRAAVQFAASIKTLHAQGAQIFLEIGPSPTLIGMGQRCLSGVDNAPLWLPSLAPKRDDWQQLLSTLSTLYCHGAAVDWAGFDRDYPRQRLALPTYPFQRQRYWLPEKSQRAQRQHAGSTGKDAHPLLGQRMRSALKETQFESFLISDTIAFLNDHRVHELAIMPAAGYLEIFLAAAVACFGSEPFELRDVTIHEALIVADGETRLLQTIVTPQQAESTVTVQIFSSAAKDEVATPWQLHAMATVHRQPSSQVAQHEALSTIQMRCTAESSADVHYAALAARGLTFGPSLQGVEQIWACSGEALGRICLPPLLTAEVDRFRLHPALLDACLQVFAAAAPAQDMLYMPISIDRFCLYEQVDTQVWSHIRLTTKHNGAMSETFRGDAHLLDSQGRVVAILEGICFKRASRSALQRRTQTELAEWIYEMRWQLQPQGKIGSPTATTAITTNQIGTAVAQRIEDVAGSSDLRQYRREVKPQLDTLCADYIIYAFQQRGWQPTLGQQTTTEALLADLTVAGQYRRLLNRFLTILAEDGWLHPEGDTWEVRCVPPPLKLADLQARWQRLVDAFPAFTAELAIAGRCGGALAAALTGDVDPLHLLFPGGDLTMTEKLYQQSPSAHAYNALVQSAITQILEQIPAEQTIRILEIGAGTGGTSSFVLPQLPADRTEYFFTDLSPLFLNRAIQKFRAYPFVRYELLDIERDPLHQGYEPHGFDLILAANVIHATAHLYQTLQRVRQLLVPGGLLLMLEMVTPERWVDLSFGLTEGWWKYHDTDRRPDYPLLEQGGWRALLTELEFSDFAIVPEAPTDPLPEQAVILARGPQTVGAPVTGTWLIMADERGVGEQLATLIQTQGGQSMLVRRGEDYAAAANRSFTVDATNPTHFRRLLTEVLKEKASLHGVIHLWNLDTPAGVEQPGEALASLEPAMHASLGSMLNLIQALVQEPMVTAHSPRLWLVTQGAQAIGRGTPVAVMQAPTWGLGKVIALEHPEFRPICLDLDPLARPEAQAQALFHQLCTPDDEEQVVLRNGSRYVPRLVRSESPAAGLPANVPVRLAASGSGLLDDLKLVPADRRAPAAGEVEIQVVAAGLNFRDLMNVLAMRADPEPLGGEVSGRIVRLGPDVKEWAVGDEVIAIAFGGFATHTTVSTSYVVRKPSHISFAQAASLPLVFLTAHYALHQLGNLQAGERVLIHAAAGGVGTAAVQLARRAGAEIFGSAGSPEKQAFLAGIGVDHVLHSRTFDFADEIMRVTKGNGVDLVLNSLAGEFITQSVAVLAPQGRFLEIGKRDIWQLEQFTAVKPDAQYFITDLSAVIYDDPALIQSMLQALVNAIACGELAPLPITTFPLTQAVDAFRYMAQAKHIGKIVLTMAAHNDHAAVEAPRPDATYLITGGLSGLGLLVAQRLVERGARHLMLMGRRPPSPQTKAVIDTLTAAGATVSIMQGDIAQAADVRRVLQSIATTMPPLRGIIHSAGLLDDGVLLRQDWARFARVLAPKVDGAWLLHVLTLDLPLDFFVLFSSAAALLGSPGQSNHAAANAFLDALAHHRRAMGLPALSINWGAWAEIGAAVQHNVGDRVKLQGMGAIAPEQGLQILERLLQEQRIQAGVLPVNWFQFVRHFAGGRLPSWLTVLANEASTQVQPPAVLAAQTAAPPDLLSRLTDAPPSKQRELLLGFVNEQVAKVMGLAVPEAIEPQRPLQAIGLDSLMAVELRNMLGSMLNLPHLLPATLVFDYPTPVEIAGYLASELLGSAREEPTDRPSASAVTPDLLATLEGLSDAEIDQLFAEQIA